MADDADERRKILSDRFELDLGYREAYQGSRRKAQVRAEEQDARRTRWEASTGWDVEDGAEPCPWAPWSGGHHHAGRDCCPPTVLELDHLYVIRADGEPGLLAMPYGWPTPAGSVRLTRWCERWGLRWEVAGEGWWAPGTVAIIITAGTTELQTPEDVIDPKETT